MESDTTVVVVMGEPTVDPVRMVLVELLCRLHALYSIHRSAHWQVVGEPYYGDHLLFQRLYKVLDAEIDKLAERMVYVIGPDTVDADLIVRAQCDMVLDWTYEESCPYARATAAEEGLVDCTERAMSALEDSNHLTLGWEDFLGAVAAQHEEHLYLLTARLG